MSNFSFSHCVFKRLVLQTRKNKGCFGKGLRTFFVFSPRFSEFESNSTSDWLSCISVCYITFKCCWIEKKKIDWGGGVLRRSAVKCMHCNQEPSGSSLTRSSWLFMRMSSSPSLVLVNPRKNMNRWTGTMLYAENLLFGTELMYLINI